jgi:SAM-dependent methyltransferase
MHYHERFQWAADAMEVKPADRILEIGCGVGFAVETIAPLLQTGTIIAIDKSATAIKRALQRNETSVALGKASFVNVELLQLPKQSYKYNKVFCFNVNFFWTRKPTGSECSIIRSVLSTNGQLYIFYGPLVRSGWEDMAEAVSTNLTKEKFKVDPARYNKRLNCFYLVARL